MPTRAASFDPKAQPSPLGMGHCPGTGTGMVINHGRSINGLALAV